MDRSNEPRVVLEPGCGYNDRLSKTAPRTRCRITFTINICCENLHVPSRDQLITSRTLAQATTRIQIQKRWDRLCSRSWPDWLQVVHFLLRNLKLINDVWAAFTAKRMSFFLSVPKMVLETKWWKVKFAFTSSSIYVQDGHKTRRC